MWILLAIFAAIALVCLWGAWRIFCRGMRDRVLAEAPYNEMAYYAAVAPVGSFIGDRVTGESDPRSLTSALIVGATLYIVGALIWAAGFAFGRFKARKTDGQITSG